VLLWFFATIKEGFMAFHVCVSCSSPFLAVDSICPHCGAALAPRKNMLITALLGLGLMGCGDTGKVDSSEPSGEPTVEPAIEPDNVEPPYGVGDLDVDQDGFYIDDCDDEDPAAFPGAAENDSTSDCMRDADNDGYGDSEPSNPDVTPGTDCNDEDATIHPNAEDPEGDGIDSNCDGIE